MDLHYSQTVLLLRAIFRRLNPLWIYTTLKQPPQPIRTYTSLNPLWIYTTLKHVLGLFYHVESLNPLWIYTTLKR